MAVLDAPEQRYASGKSGPRRVAGSLRRDLQEDFANDFDKNYGASRRASRNSVGTSSVEDALGADDFDSASFDASLPGDDAPFRRRVAGRGRVRPGLLGRVVDAMPRTLWGRIAAGVGFFGVIGVALAGFWAVRSALLHDARFVIPSSSAIGVEGNQHVTKAQLLSIFGGDVDRNIFTVSLAERRAQLERLPWVEHATVMRLLPDHLRVSIVERTPIAFVRQGNHIGLVDKNGVLMDMVSGAGEATGGGAHYSFPVVTGIAANEPLSTRMARMKIFNRFTTELDADGRKISEGLSEVDLSDPEDVKALIPDEHSEVMVHFGDSDFLDRYDKYKAHLAEWRSQYPRLSSVDMRYDRQVVLEMQPGSTLPVAGTGTPAPQPGAEAKSQAMHAAATAPPPGSRPLSFAKPAIKPVPKPVSATSPQKANPPVENTAAKPASVTSSSAAPVPAVTLAAPHHLSVAKDVPTTNKPAGSKPAAKNVPAKKIVAKKPAAKKAVVKTSTTATHHAPAVPKP